MTVLVGLDLAWSGHRPSGVCALSYDDGDARCESLWASACPPENLFRWLEGLGPDVIAAIDAPLIVRDGRRAEADLARAFRGTGLYAYSARWDFLSRHRITAGPELGALLDCAGWNLDPSRISNSGRHAVEVYPHAVTVSLLGAERILRYKKGARADRLVAYSTLQELLGSTTRKWGANPRSPFARRLATLAAGLRGLALKTHEDELDAIACAVAAWHFAREGQAGMRVFGDAGEGYIAVPVPTCARGQTYP